MQDSHFQGVSDALLAGSLVAAPAWTAALGDVNALLSMISLIVGLLIGATRLWQLWRGKP